MCVYASRSRRSRLVCCLLLLPLLFLGGCITTPQRGGGPAYTVEGIEYGVTAGRFRGRWWNYYERGRSFLEGGFYDEARQDLEIALKYRSRDQLWPRTYGLHFTPEYFPHRELGIVHYHQGDLEGALRELETSIGQRHSARAAYYIGEARRAVLEQSGADREAPRIELATEQTPVGATTYTLRGVAQDDQFVETIVIDGAPFDVRLSAPEVHFEAEVALGPGQNEVEIVCTDLMGKTTTVLASIEADLDGPLLSFDAPMILPGTVSGVAYDPAGIAALEIAGKPVDVQPGPDGVAPFSVQVARENLETSALYRCEDALGNVTQGVLAPDLILLQDQMPSVVPASASQAVTLPGGQRLYYLANQLIAMAPASDAALGPRVAMTNIEEGRRYFLEEVAVNIRVDSDRPIISLELNGEAFPTIPGRNTMQASRRVRLAPGENSILGQMLDSEGRTAEDHKTVRRELTIIDLDNDTENEYKLSFALLRRESLVQNAQLQSNTEYTLNAFMANPRVVHRFLPVERDYLGVILQEQQLSALLGDKDWRLQQERIVAADMILVARVSQEADTIEIVLDGSSTETGVRIATHVDACGPIDQLDEIIDTLALRLVQEFPRLQGRIIKWTDPDVLFRLTKAHGLRPSLKCMVLREEEITDPETNETLGTDYVFLAEGSIQTVSDNFSKAQVRPRNDTGGTDSVQIEMSDSVVIK